MLFFSAQDRPEHMSVAQKLWQINWALVLLICVTAAIGIAMLYSAANGNWDPWASRQVLRFGISLGILICIAVVDIRIWMRYAYAAYFGLIVLLLAVEVAGSVGMGAKRWINLGFFQLQPSELTKVVMVLALARYFHSANPEDIARPTYLVVPVLIMLAPVLLVMRQPDLGTAVMLLFGGAAVFFLAGVRLWVFGAVIVAGLAALPIAWQFLQGYQQKRVLTFLDPESDPLGAGYHILQSKIALGSGGLFGKGFLQGTQSHLNFLPEKQTDFIFTMLAEELGLFGGLVLISLYVLLIAYGLAMSLKMRNQFGRLVGMGVTTTLFLYVFINIAMVMGLIPVVGVPLPLISHGGTALLTMMIGFGFLMSAYVHRDARISRYGHTESS